MVVEQITDVSLLSCRDEECSCKIEMLIMPILALVGFLINKQYAGSRSSLKMGVQCGSDKGLMPQLSKLWRTWKPCDWQCSETCASEGSSRNGDFMAFSSDNSAHGSAHFCIQVLLYTALYKLSDWQRTDAEFCFLDET
jgi:hypothetical protein